MIDQAARTRWTETARRWAAVATCLLVLVPLLCTEIPPVLDYPNHLARLYIEARGSTDPFLSRVYAPAWSVIPNLGIDLIGVPLLALLPIYVAGKVLLALALLMPMLGTFAYSRAVCGVRSLWPLGSGLIAFNATFLLGFMNFEISVGGALLAAAFWARWRGRRPVWALAATSAAAAVIFFVHLFGVLFLLLLIGAHEAVSLRGSGGDARALARRAASSVACCAAVAAGPALLLLASPFAAADGPTQWPLAALAIRWAFAPFLGYVLWFDALTALAVLATVLLCLRFGKAAFAAEAWIAFGALALIYPFTPSNLHGGAFISMRLPSMAGLLLFAGFVPRGLTIRVGTVVACGFALLLLVRTAVVGTIWHGQGEDVADLRRVLSHVQPASKVLLANAVDPSKPEFWLAVRYRWLPSALIFEFNHLPALLVIERGSIWPLLFAEPSQQPLMVRPEFRSVTRPLGRSPDLGWLTEDRPATEQLRLVPYLDHWPDKFDHVLVLGADESIDLQRFRPDRLELIDRTTLFALFRVIKASPVRP